jgi:hypothetical protein
VHSCRPGREGLEWSILIYRATISRSRVRPRIALDINMRHFDRILRPGKTILTGDSIQKLLFGLHGAATCSRIGTPRTTP